MIDKERLKALALLATKSKWTTDDLNEVMSAESDQLNGGCIIADCQGPDRWRNAEFIAAASPARVLALLAEIERLESLKPEWPPRPPDGEGLPRYGLRWNGPQQPLAVPMTDGYWTPWHLAEQLRKDRDALLEAGGHLL